MLPKWHIFFGAIFAGILWYFAQDINPFYIVLVFFASFLIDLDHYFNAVRKTGKLGLNHALEYHKNLAEKENAELKKGVKNKESFHIFHTIEFHILILIIGLAWTPFFYIFLGMIFHSLLDIFTMLYMNNLYRREFFFFNWLRKKF